ncbi:NADH-quinone oxidoreductase subunit A [Conexibacter sp. DBS9H8]|uniref:NADH-quinone oxidoreductase subunit A n=1 Tax=Conexibacter sp. DBS9H8 TaxID=2937801 RepID=UPI00201008D0|nr:NADH-quinone oxidoreductase subunit A [Conexibacter sp. DBS9H8]
MRAVGLLFVLMALVVGLLAAAYAATLLRRGVRRVRAGERPSWPRYHVRFYSFALLFIAFDMEMAYMYPWAVVFRAMGVIAYGEVGFFLTVLGLGILYAWREGALEWS